MSAYAIARNGRSTSPLSLPASRRSKDAARVLGNSSRLGRDALVGTASQKHASVLDELIDDLAERVAAAVTARLMSAPACADPQWLDSRGAAEYLGIHRDTLRKLAAEQTIPSHQDGPGCKLFFCRSDLDEWRRSGGRVVQLSSVAADAA